MQYRLYTVYIGKVKLVKHDQILIVLVNHNT